MTRTPGRRRAAGHGSAYPVLAPPSWVGATVAGIFSGLLAVGLVWAGLHGCDAVRGRPSCGGWGIGMLVIIVVVMLLVGAMVGKVLQVPDAGVVAFFGVTLALILMLLFAVDHAFSIWMVVVLPLVTAACFAAASVLTRALEGSQEPGYVDDRTGSVDEDGGEGEDPEASPADESTATRRLPRYAPDERDRSSAAAGGEQPTTGPGTDETARLRGDDGAPLLHDESDSDEETPGSG
ncbi:MAG: hypothetical protein ACRDQA_06785 [Nocardioidaceae bacterium]